MRSHYTIEEWEKLAPFERYRSLYLADLFYCKLPPQSSCPPKSKGREEVPF